MDTSAKQTLPKINYGLPILPLIDSLYQLLIGALICIVSLAFATWERIGCNSFCPVGRLCLTIPCAFTLSASYRPTR